VGLWGRKGVIMGVESWGAINSMIDIFIDGL
jgi:hypothetical protein